MYIFFGECNLNFVEKYRINPPEVYCLLFVFLLSFFPIPFGNVFHKKGSTETDECDTDTESTESTGNSTQRNKKNVPIVYTT